MDDAERAWGEVFGSLHEPKCTDCQPTSQPTFSHWPLQNDSQRKAQTHSNAAKNYERC
jgi:hypothetical protein